MSQINRFYQDELAYLKELGRQFGRENPRLAPFLDHPDSDPDVERILEGTAFLCGRVRERLDDDLPQITGSLMSMLWPHYLRPVPSMTIMQLMPEQEGQQAAIPIAKGAEFHSIPVGAGTAEGGRIVEPSRCRYRTAFAGIVRPWSLIAAKMEAEPSRNMRLLLRFAAGPKASIADMDLRAVQLHLSSPELRPAFQLYLNLLENVKDVVITDGSDRLSRPEYVLSPKCIRPVGLNRDEALLPYPHHAFAGYRLLQEYFAFRQRFLFVDVVGLQVAARALGLTQTMEIAISFERRIDPPPTITLEDVKIHCIPTINLFEHHATPFDLDHQRSEYLVLPESSGLGDRTHAEIFSITAVRGMSRAAGLERRAYEPFFTFAHLKESDRRRATYYHATRVPDVFKRDTRHGTDIYMSFVNAGDNNDTVEESISIDLTCTNRGLPQLLKPGDIREPGDLSPPGIRFANLGAPTPTLAPPLGKLLHWRLVTHLSLNYVSLADAAHLRKLLMVYEFMWEHDEQRRTVFHSMLEGIVSVRSRVADMMGPGGPMRGVQTLMVLDEEKFAWEGDAYLFAVIMNRFLALYVSVNSLSELTVKFRGSGRTIRFRVNGGEQPTPASEDRFSDDPLPAVRL